MAQIRTQSVTYAAGDITGIGYLAMPEGNAAGPGVLVAHEGPGLDTHVRRRTEMLAELGYVAFAADMHGDGRVAASHEEVLERVGALLGHRDVMRGRIRAALDILRAQPGVLPGQLAAIGYCFGGATVLELARSGAPILGVVAFHGLLATPTLRDAGEIAGKVLVCTGGADHLVPREQVLAFQDEMDAAGVDWQVIQYGGVKHAFTNFIEAEELARHGFGYDRNADRRSWAAMRDFLNEIFGTLPHPAPTASERPAPTEDLAR